MKDGFESKSSYKAHYHKSHPNSVNAVSPSDSPPISLSYELLLIPEEWMGLESLGFEITARHGTYLKVFNLCSSGRL